MAKVRVRPGNNMLLMDFYFRGQRCREQTALNDTTENRRKVQTLLNRIKKEIEQGTFDYAKTFPGSKRGQQFSTDVQSGSDLASPSLPTLAKREVPLFGEFSITWRAEMAPQWRRQHRMGVDAIFKRHLTPVFDKRGLAEITKAEVLSFRATIADMPGRGGKKMSSATINKVMCILRQILNEAAERFLLPDIFKGIKRLKGRKPEVHPFSFEQVEKICSTIREDFKNYVKIRFFTGLRTGEINGLKWKYVDFERGLILVREVFSAGEAEENAKNETSLRDIPMLPNVRQALEDQKRFREPGSEYVFSTRGGGPIDAHNFATRVWYPLLRFLDIEKRRPYQTRHTTATLMLASGENPEWIARLMGHANTQMLFTVYSRFVPNLTREDGRAITGVLNSRLQPVTEVKNEVVKEVGLELATLSREQLEAMVRSLSINNHKESEHAE